MTDLAAETRVLGVSIQAVEYARERSEPGQIMSEFIGDWVRGGISPRSMLQATEILHGVRLSTVAETTLGAWAHEETKRHNDKQAQQGAL